MAAHSASRCDLLERLGLSFRLIYRRLPILVTCECAEEVRSCLVDGTWHWVAHWKSKRLWVFRGWCKTRAASNRSPCGMAT